MTLESPDDLNRFVGIQGAAFTTGSEWLGALGTAIKGIRNECRLPPALDTKLDQIMTEVRRVWPRL